MTVADSKRLRILKALTAHLQTLTPTADWDFDLTDSVYRGRTVFGDETPLPMVSILDNQRPDIGLFAAEERTKRAEDWILLVQGWVADDKANPTDEAFNFLAAVEQKLSEVTSTNSQGDPRFPDAYMLSGLITGLRIGPGIARPPQEGLSSRAFFYLPLTVSLSTDLTNQFGS